MILYNTSYVQVPPTDVLHSRRAVDFGKGFYLTSIKRQAEDYAERFTKDGRNTWLNTYELQDDLNKRKVKVFPEYDEEWLDFVFRCRKGLPVEYFDMVVGGVADDREFETANLYLMEMIDKATA